MISNSIANAASIGRKQGAINHSPQVSIVIFVCCILA